MVLDLKPVFIGDNERLTFDFQLDLSGMDISGVCPFRSPIRVKGEVAGKAGIVTLSAIVEYVYQGPCDRCSQPVSVSRQVPVTTTVVRELFGEEDDRFLVCENMRLDADSLFTEEVLLSLPMKFLCQEDCRGICLNCGQNLNEEHCGCSRKESDPRLEKLRQLIREVP